MTDPFLTTKQHVGILQKGNVHVSYVTVWRRLKEAGFKNVRPERKPRLTAAMRMKRLAWAREHEDWTEEDWRKVVFSDESTFECQDESQPKVWHKMGSPKPTVP